MLYIMHYTDMKECLAKRSHEQKVVSVKLMEETEVKKFEMLLTKTVQQLQTNATTAEFGQYFVNTYMRRKEQWASCYRQQSFINTNMHVEAFHHVLKYIYLNGKVNKCVDKCIHKLLKISRDKTFERIIKLTKGKKKRKSWKYRKGTVPVKI